MALDGEQLGLWYCQRITVEDLENKRFRANMAFYVDKAGQYTLEFKPYREHMVRWMSAELEIDPEDRLVPIPKIKCKSGASVINYCYRSSNLL